MNKRILATLLGVILAGSLLTACTESEDCDDTESASVSNVAVASMVDGKGGGSSGKKKKKKDEKKKKKKGVGAAVGAGAHADDDCDDDD